jgi:hypothetical protein
MQRQLLQFAAVVLTGTTDTRAVTEKEREALRLYVKVTGGSSNLDVDIREQVERVLKKMIDKMNGRQAATVILGLGLLIAAGWSLSSWLETERAKRVEELKSAEHVQALQALSFANQGQIETFKRVLDVLERQGPEGKRAVETATSTYDALLKAASRTPESEINGQTITGGDAATLRVSPRKRPVTRIVTQEMRVIKIDTEDDLNLDITLKDENSSEQYRLKFGDAFFADRDRGKLFAALDRREPIWVELEFKEVAGEVRSVTLLRVTEDPTVRQRAEVPASRP